MTQRVCNKKAKEENSNFKYSISSILKNLYDAYNSSKISAREKLEIKNLLFSKSSAIKSILEELKNPNLFDKHLNTLKKIIKTKLKTEAKTASKKNNLSSIKILFSNDSSKKIKKFFKESESLPSEGLNQSLFMDSNESIIFIEKTNQNLFSEEEDENLSTTLGLELFNLSTNPSTPLNARKNLKNENEIKLPTKSFKQGVDSESTPRQEKNISKTSNNIIKIENVTKRILNDKTNN